MESILMYAKLQSGRKSNFFLNYSIDLLKMEGSDYLHFHAINVQNVQKLIHPQ